MSQKEVIDVKKELSPAVAGVVIAMLLIVAVFFLYRSTAGPGGPGPGQVGNPSPFAPGGAAQGQGGMQGRGPGGAPTPPGGAPGSGGAPTSTGG